MWNTVKYMRELAKEMVRCRRKTKFKAGVKQKKQHGIWNMPKFAFYSCLKPQETQWNPRFPGLENEGKIKNCTLVWRQE